ncbi:hypothetical protein OGZ02_17225 [Brachyspira hyodysenteriae]|nr:hypothetical protein [Brachyspira hyodysenteriae]MDA1470486.1 hypothetical protein [Brachyspira hyodysenteriae]
MNLKIILNLLIMSLLKVCNVSDFIHFDYYNINPKYLEPQIVDFIAIKSTYDKDKSRHVSYSRL